MATRTTEGGDTKVYVERGGGGAGALLIGLGILAMIGLIFFFVTQSTRNDEIRTTAVTSAASSVADSASTAADRVGDAADRATENVAPTRP